MQVLHGHNSPETAFVAESYPYGFRLRCKARWWLETAVKGAKKGETRLMFQTTNPKVAGEVWNKPKAGTYSMFLLMYLDEKEHVQNDGITEHIWPDKLAEFKEKFWHQLDEEQKTKVAALERLSRYYNPGMWQRAEAS